MVEKEARLAVKEAGIKGVFHEEEDIHIVRLWFRGDKGAEYNESRDLSCGLGDAIDSLQAPGYHDPPCRPRAEALKDFMDCRGMNAGRQVVAIDELW